MNADSIQFNLIQESIVTENIATLEHLLKGYCKINDRIVFRYRDQSGLCQKSNSAENIRLCTLHIPKVINELHSCGSSLLHTSVAKYNQLVVKLLLEYGSDPNQLDNDGRTCVFYAINDCVQRRRDESRKFISESVMPILQLLLDYGANPYCITKDGLSALHLAIEARSSGNDIARLLLKRGVDPSKQLANNAENPITKCKYNKGETALHTAVKLFSSVEDSTIRTAQLLLEFGANPSTADYKGWTPLHYAVAGGRAFHTSIAQLLLQAGSCCNIQIKHIKRYRGYKPGYSPLHFSVSQIKSEATKILLKNGASINLQDVNGSTALHTLYSKSQSLYKFVLPSFSILAMLISAGSGTTSKFSGMKKLTQSDRMSIDMKIITYFKKTRLLRMLVEMRYPFVFQKLIRYFEKNKRTTEIDLLSNILYLYSIPQSLKRLSSNAVRKFICEYPTNVWVGIKNCALPVQLQEFVTFEYEKLLLDLSEQYENQYQVNKRKT